MDLEPKGCPKCMTDAVMPTGISEIMICAKCSTIYKSTEFGTLEEITELDLSLLDADSRDVISKFKALVKGELKLDFGIKDVGKAAEALGVIMANTLAEFRNTIFKTKVIPVQALDNILIQAMITQLSISLAQMTRRPDDSEDVFRERVKSLSTMFNITVKAYIEKFSPESTIVMVDMSEDEEGKKHDERGTG